MCVYVCVCIYTCHEHKDLSRICHYHHLGHVSQVGSNMQTSRSFMVNSILAFSQGSMKNKPEAGPICLCNLIMTGF